MESGQPTRDPENDPGPALVPFRRPAVYALIFFIVWIAFEVLVFGVKDEYWIVVKHVQRHEYALGC